MNGPGSLRPLLKLFGAVLAVLLAMGAVATAAPTQAAGPAFSSGG
ncbi:hypothetical protein J2X46_000905 [Nocardioides sp. BE266]|nr:hypothetical protein [Nocardioides sp. BE266]MDR7251929.1 hypothetical protein [Nocardioides sp. BE266]